MSDWVTDLGLDRRIRRSSSSQASGWARARATSSEASLPRQAVRDWPVGVQEDDAPQFAVRHLRRPAAGARTARATRHGELVDLGSRRLGVATRRDLLHHRTAGSFLAGSRAGFRRRIRGRDRRRTAPTHRAADDVPGRGLDVTRPRSTCGRPQDGVVHGEVHGSADIEHRSSPGRPLAVARPRRRRLGRGRPARPRARRAPGTATTGSGRCASTPRTRQRPHSSSASASRCARHASSRSGSAPSTATRSRSAARSCGRSRVRSGSLDLDEVQGISAVKVGRLRDLARAALDGRLDTERLRAAPRGRGTRPSFGRCRASDRGPPRRS